MKLTNPSVLFLILLFGLLSVQSTMGQQTNSNPNSEAFTIVPHANEIPSSEAMKMMLKKGAALKNQRAVIKIPVVFHVVCSNPNSKLSVQNAENALVRMSENYQMMNSDFDYTNDVNSDFHDIIANCEIEFELAQLDPNGNSTTGVTYTNSNLDGSNMWNSPPKNAINWNEDANEFRYLQIWVVNTIDGSDNASGWSYLPSQVVGYEIAQAGIVYNYRYITGNDNTYMQDVLTHEVGHFFGLPHTFGNTVCGSWECGDDNIDDTPPTPCYAHSCVEFNPDYEGYCGNPSDIGTMSSNFMCYSSCACAFTEDQKSVMYYWLNEAPFSNLPTNDNLIATGLLNPSGLYASFSASATNINTGESINYSNTSTGNITSYSWIFEGGSPGTSSLENPGAIQYNTTGTFTTTLTVSDGNNESTHTMSINVMGINPDAEVFCSDNLELDVYKYDYNAEQWTQGGLLACNATNDWQDLSFRTHDNNLWYNIGLWFHEGAIRLESFEKNLVCNNTTTSTANIVPLPYNTEIGPNAIWNPGGAFPDEHYFTPEWNGQTAYVGFKDDFGLGNGDYYGWIEIQVNSDGSEYNVIDYGICDSPNTPINAGRCNIVTGFAETVNTLDIKVYPNPSSGKFNISGLKQGDKSIISVYDYKGSLIKTYTDVETIDISDRAKGFYYLSVETNHSLISYQKIILVK